MKRLVLLLGILVWATGSPAPATEAPEAGYRSPEQDIRWITEGSNITQIATGLWYVRHHWYGQLSVGGLSAFANRENAFFLGLQAGRRFPLIPRLYLAADLGYRHVIPDGSPDPAIDTGRFFTLEGRLRLELVIGRHLTVFLGGGYANLYQGYSLGSDTERKGTVFWGVGLL